MKITLDLTPATAKALVEGLKSYVWPHPSEELDTFYIGVKRQCAPLYNPAKQGVIVESRAHAVVLLGKSRAGQLEDADTTALWDFIYAEGMAQKPYLFSLLTDDEKTLVNSRRAYH